MVIEKLKPGMTLYHVEEGKKEFFKVKVVKIDKKNKLVIALWGDVGEFCFDRNAFKWWRSTRPKEG